MKIRCGGWVEPKHKPLITGIKEPFDDNGVTDGVCKDCLKQLKKTGVA